MLTPENELGVIVRFAQEAHHYGFEIHSISIAFPDAIIEKSGKVYRAEFEFMASSFEAHGHDCRKCDLIICWQNDCDNGILPTIPLAEEGWMNTDLTLPTEEQRDICYWKRRAQKAERALQLAKGKSDNSSALMPLVCSICGARFATQAALSGHGNAHRRLANHIKPLADSVAAGESEE